MSSPEPLQLVASYSTTPNSSSLATPNNNVSVGGGSGSQMTTPGVILTPRPTPTRVTVIEACSICSEPWDQENHRLCALPCGHMYGKSCITGWAIQKLTSAHPCQCPQCKADFKVGDILLLYPVRLDVADDKLHRDVWSLQAQMAKTEESIRILVENVQTLKVKEREQVRTIENQAQTIIKQAEALSRQSQTILSLSLSLSEKLNERRSTAEHSTLPDQFNQVIQSLDRISDLLNSSSDDELVGLLDSLVCLCDGDHGNVALARRNGAVKLMCEVCRRSEGVRVRVSALSALALFLCDIQSTEIFRQIGGPKMLVSILKNGIGNMSLLDSGFAVVAVAATGNKVMKESFVELCIHDLIVEVMRKYKKGTIPSLYDAMRVLLITDDNRVVASQGGSHGGQGSPSDLYPGPGVASTSTHQPHPFSQAPTSSTLSIGTLEVNDEEDDSVQPMQPVTAVEEHQTVVAVNIERDKDVTQE